VSQLVGSACVICRQRIPSILAGKECEGCHSPVHIACLASVSNEQMGIGCKQCGATPELAYEISKEFIQEQSEAPVKAPVPVTLKKVLNSYQIIRWTIGCIAFLILGIIFMIFPLFPDDPRHITLQDRAIGMLFIVAAPFCGIIAYFFLKKRASLK